MPAIALHRISHQTTTGIPYQHLHIQITTADGLITPHDLQGLDLPSDIIWSQGVVLEGKAPIWLYGYLIHACHPAAWIACFDPRLGDPTPHSGGAVIIATHTHDVATGDILKINLPL
ncbi:MAG: CRISPR-associated protein Csx3 [Leptolyngbyaceae cyanobacterium RU_5_1]|nr:CRISPR-associated protein Csx3 [Leptolyngbyaceae cyanobacterium RU_5_1]